MLADMRERSDLRLHQVTGRCVIIACRAVLFDYDDADTVMRTVLISALRRPAFPGRRVAAVPGIPRITRQTVIRGPAGVITYAPDAITVDRLTRLSLPGDHCPFAIRKIWQRTQPAAARKGHEPACPGPAALEYLEMIRNFGESATPSHQSLNCAITVSVSCQLVTGTQGTPRVNTG
jgi:hypothetical protein